MSWAAVVGGVIAVGGAALGADASRKAANTQADAANNASRLRWDQYQQTRSDLSPWMQGGNVALKDLNYLMGMGPQHIPNAPGSYGQLTQPFGLEQFHQSPSYQFNLQQGQQAIDKASAARGNFYAPQTLQDMAKFSQGLAGNDFNNAFNQYNTSQNELFARFNQLSGAGQNAAAQLGGYGGAAAAGVGNNLMDAGNAQAAGTMGQANAIAGGMGGAYNAYLLQQILARNQQPTYPSEAP